jgi:hypothetical protein
MAIDVRDAYIQRRDTYVVVSEVWLFSARSLDYSARGSEGEN